MISNIGTTEIKKRTKSKRELVTRRTFIKAGAGATIAAGCLSIGSTMAIAADHPWKTVIATTYICPPCGLPCDKIIFDKPGSCPTCGMTLVPVDDSADAPPKVSILVFNGTELIDFAGPWEVFGTAGFLVHTVAEKLDPLTMVFGQKVIADYTFDTAPKSDILLVPGGGVFQQMENERLIRWIQEKSKSVRNMMSVCTGVFLLAKSGLLQGQTVTATYGMIEDLVEPQTKVVYDQRFVDNGKIITTAGLSSGIDGALHLVAKVLGKGNAQAVALEMEYPWKPDGTWARAAMADRYLPDGLAYSKPKIKGAEASMISTDGSSDHWETKLWLESRLPCLRLLRCCVSESDPIRHHKVCTNQSRTYAVHQGSVPLMRTKSNGRSLMIKHVTGADDPLSNVRLLTKANSKSLLRSREQVESQLKPVSLLRRSPPRRVRACFQFLI